MAKKLTKLAGRAQIMSEARKRVLRLAYSDRDIVSGRGGTFIQLPWSFVLKTWPKLKGYKAGSYTARVTVGCGADVRIEPYQDDYWRIVSCPIQPGICDSVGKCLGLKANGGIQTVKLNLDLIPDH